MENSNLEDWLNPEKMANPDFFSTCIWQTNEAKEKSKRSEKKIETNINQCVHSSRKGKQSKCINCKIDNKSRLKSCNICYEFKCKNCIKNEAVVKTTKKLRDPMLYICHNCLLKSTKERVKPCSLIDLKSNSNSVEDKGKPSDIFLDGNEVILQKKEPNLVINKGMCQSCKYFKKNIWIMKTFYELVLNAMKICDANPDSLVLMKKKLFCYYYQTVNPINIFSDFPLPTVLIMCEDCLKNFVNNAESFGKGIFGENKTEEVDNMGKELLCQFKTIVDQFAEKYKRNQLMFEATLKKIFDQKNQSESKDINSNEDSSIESTLTLDSINKNCFQLVQEFKGNMENLTQYPLFNQQTPYQQQHYPYQNPSLCQYQCQEQLLHSLGYNMSYPLTTFNVFPFNHQ